MPAPRGGIFPCPIAFGLRGVQDALNAPAKTGGSLRLFRQMGCRTASTSSVVMPSTAFSRRGVRINLERHRPLGLVLIVAEAVGQIARDLIGKIPRKSGRPRPCVLRWGRRRYARACGPSAPFRGPRRAQLPDSSPNPFRAGGPATGSGAPISSRRLARPPTGARRRRRTCPTWRSPPFVL